MSEQQETVHVVLRGRRIVSNGKDVKMPCTQAMKVFDDRADARAYRIRMNKVSLQWWYTVQSCLRG